MHITMNRFEVANGEQKKFEQSIKEHYEQLKGTRGYLSFHLIRGGTNGTVTFYSSHTKWANKEDFLEWDKVAQLRKTQGSIMNIERVNNRKPFLRNKLKTYLKNFYSRAKV